MSVRAIFYDTETTGINPRQDRVIELAAYDAARDLSFVKLINPGMPIPAEASAVHHITNEMVADAPSFKDVIDEFTAFCEGDVILVAHNNDAFDIHFMREEFERNGSTLPSQWRFLDTLKWARRYRPDLPRHNLQFLRSHYGFAENNAHRALDDVLMLRQVFMAMCDDLTIDEAYALMSRKGRVTRMPFGKHRGLLLEQVPKEYLSWLQGQGGLDKAGAEELKEALLEKGLISAT